MSVRLPHPAELREQLAALEPLGLSAALRVSVAGRPHFEGAWGFADRAAGRALTVETVTDIGSVSKQFTSAAAVLLAARGELDLHRPLAELLPGVPANRAQATVHQLLAHTAGFDHEHFLTDFDEMTGDEAEQRSLALPLAAPLGERYRYSNTGYTLAARVVERVAGLDFRRFVHEQLLAPAGLEATGWYNEPHLAGRSFAHGYASDVDQGSPYDFHGPTWALLGNGGMLSTLADLDRWVQALRDDVLFERRWHETLVEPGLGGYALGWRIWHDGAAKVIEHGGASQYGHSALLRRYEDDDVTVAIAFNADYAGTNMISVVGDRLARVVTGREQLDLPAVAERTASARSLPAGRYRAADGWGVDVVEEAGATVLMGADPAGCDALAGTDVAAEVERRRDASVAVAEALSRGELEAVREQLSLRVRPQTAEFLHDMWQIVAAEQPVTGLACLGGEPARILREVDSDLVTVEVVSETLWPAPEPLLTVYVRLLGDGPGRCLRLVWAADGLAGSEGAVADVLGPGQLRVAPLRDGGALAMDLRTWRPVLVEAEDDRLTIRSGDAAAVAVVRQRSDASDSPGLTE